MSWRRTMPSSRATSAQPTVWAARYLTMNGCRRLPGSFTHASMANAMPQSHRGASVGVDTDVQLQNPDFARFAEAAGLLGLRTETTEEVRPKIAQALYHDGPALVEVHTARQELAQPLALR